MSNEKLEKRRNFLKSAVAGGVGMLASATVAKTAFAQVQDDGFEGEVLTEAQVEAMEQADRELSPFDELDGSEFAESEEDLLHQQSEGGEISAAQLSGDTTDVKANALIRFFTKNLERMRITDAGGLNIGTANPGVQMYLRTAWRQVAVFQSMHKDNVAKIIFRTKTGTEDQIWINNFAGLFNIRSLNITKTGRFGIGTHEPRTPFHLKTGWRSVGIIESTNPKPNLWLKFITSEGPENRVEVCNRKGGRFAVWVAEGKDAFNVLKNGRVGIGTTAPKAKLDVNGTTRTKVLQITGGSDLAEPFNINRAHANGIGANGTGANGANGHASDGVMPGMVVAIDPENPGELRIADKAYDKSVAGIISGAGNVNPGLILEQEESVASGKHPVALTGRVFVYVDSSNGEVQPGDMLTTSNTPGYAMKVTDHEEARGAVIGKAMTPVDPETGLVFTLVSLQ